MNELALYPGAGGGLLGTKLLGWRCIGYVEINEYRQKILSQRIKDGFLDEAPIFGDVKLFLSEGYARSYTGLVDVLTAGFPCQPFSIAGKNLGKDDERNVWPETIECIRTIRPRIVLLENVPNLLAHEYIQRIYGELVEAGYDAWWDCVSAADVGANHLRERWWCIAWDTRWVAGFSDSSDQRCDDERDNREGRPVHVREHEGAPTQNQQERGKRFDRVGKIGEVFPNANEGRLSRTRARTEEHDASLRGEGDVGNAENDGVEGFRTEREQSADEDAQEGSAQRSGGGTDAVRNAEQRGRSGEQRWRARQIVTHGRWWATEPSLGGTFDGLASQLDIIKTIIKKRIQCLV